MTETLNSDKSRAGHRSTAALALCALALAALWSVTIWRLGGMWSALPEYSYGWSVPILCAMLLWERWRARAQARETTGQQDHKTTRPQDNKTTRQLDNETEVRGQRSVVSGPVVSGPVVSGPVVSGPVVSGPVVSGLVVSGLVVFLLLFVLARLALEVIPNWRIAAWVMALSVVTITFLLLRMILGAREQQKTTGPQDNETTRPQSVVSGPVVSSPVVSWSYYAFPFAFFLLAVPWPSRFEIPFIQGLTQLNATVTVELLSFLQVAAVRMGNIILIEPGMVGVQEACSGIRSFQSTLMVALFLGELFRFSFWRRVVFVVLGAFFSFLFNIVRTSFLVLECNRSGLQAVDKFHDPAGWTVFAASFVALAVIGWVLFRQQAKQKQGAGSGKRGAGNTEALKSEGNHGCTRVDTDGTTDVQGSKFKVQGSTVQRPQPATPSTETPSPVPCPPSPVPCRQPPTSAPRGLWSVVCGLLLAVLLTEAGIGWWFQRHEQRDAQVTDWTTAFGQRAEDRGQSPEVSGQWSVVSGQPGASSSSGFSPLTISKEVKALLQYDQGAGWSWQGGGGERWQAFYFDWNPPRNLAEKIIRSGSALGHQPEVCFTAAGMELRKVYGKQRYVANGVPLVFKVYEFVDRNIPIFVFACTWQDNAVQLTTVEEEVRGDASTSRGLREVMYRYAHGVRGITDEVRVLKFGVWGPRTIAEAEAAFQQQLAALIQPKAGPLATRPLDN